MRLVISISGYPELIRAQLAIPTELSILCGLAIGYPDPPLWFPTGKDSVPTDSGHSVRVLLDPAARLELGARWVNS